MSEAMKDKKIKMYQLEKMTGINRMTLMNYNRGKYEPVLSRALKIAKALDFSLDALKG